MGRGFTIYFRDNKISRITGARGSKAKARAAAFGAEFLEAMKPSAEAPPPTQVEAPAPRKPRLCAGCNQTGHNVRTCPVANPVVQRAREERRAAEKMTSRGGRHAR